MEDLICVLCEFYYNSEDKLPRLFPNCGHTFCNSCIIEMIEKNKEEIFCPEDKVKCEFYREELGIEAFPINFALQNLLQNSKIKEKKKEKEKNEEIDFSKEENYDNLISSKDSKILYNNARKNSRISDFSGINYCLDHQKIADLICLTDKSIICSDCVLFGDHKNHNYNKVIDFKKKVKAKIFELEKREGEYRYKNEFDIFDEKKDFKEYLKKKVLDSKLKLSMEIKDTFQTLRVQLKEKESKLKEDLQKYFSKINQNLKIVKNTSDKIHEKKKDFKKKINKIREELDAKNPNFEFLLKEVYLNKNLMNFQKDLTEDLKEQEKQTKMLIEEELEKFELETNLDPIIDEIQNCFDLIINEDKNPKSVNNESSHQSPEKEKFENKDHSENEEISLDKVSLSQISDKDVEDESEIKQQNDQKTISKNTSFLKKEETGEGKKSLSVLKRNYRGKEQMESQSDLNYFTGGSSSLYIKNADDNSYPSSIYDSQFGNNLGLDLKNNSFNRLIEDNKIINNNNNFGDISIKKSLLSKREIEKQVRTFLVFSRMNISDNLLHTFLKEIKDDPNIKSVDFSYNQITSKGFEKIIKTLYNHPALEKIFLKFNFLDEDIFKTLNSYVKKLSKLKFFYLEENKISKKKSTVKINLSALAKFGIKIKLD